MRRRKRSEIIAERAKALNPTEQQIAQIENSIEVYEKEIHHLNEAVQAASEAKDGTKIVQISQSLYTCQSAIDQLFDNLEKLTTELETQTVFFDKKLQHLEDSKDF